MVVDGLGSSWEEIGGPSPRLFLNLYNRKETLGLVDKIMT